MRQPAGSLRKGVPAAEAGISPSYWWWLFGTVWTLLGTQILSFGLGWAASGNGGAAAGLVLTAVTLPRVVFALHGGVAADRSGPWKMMIRMDGLMFCVSAAAAALVFSLGTPLWLLLGTAAVLGTADAFYRPASGSFPRFLTPGSGLLRATAARQALIQLTAAAGPAAGGVVVAWLTLGGSAAAAAVGYLFMFAVLLSLRGAATAATGGAGGAGGAGLAAPGSDPAHASVTAPVTSPRRSILREAADGLRLAWSLPQVRAVLGLLAAVSGLVLPLTTLLVPLLARNRDWDAAAAGTVSGGYAAGMAVVVLLIVVRGQRAFAWFPPVAGLVLCGAAMVAMAWVPGMWLCCVLSVVAGLGTGVFSAKAAPLLLLLVPESHLGRIQSVALLAQMLPLLVANNVLGWMSDAIGPAMVIAGCGAATALVAGCCLGNPRSAGWGGTTRLSGMALTTAEPGTRTRTTVLWFLLGLPAALVLVVFGAQIHGLDFTVYREGALAFLGRSEHQLYDPALVQTDTRGLPFTYPPFAALLLTPFAFMPEALGLVLLTATSCVCLVLTAFLVARYLQENEVIPERFRAARGGSAGVVVLATLLIGVLGPWREGLGFGQINPMLMLLIVADLLRPAGRVPRGMLIGLAAGIKLTPLAFGLIFLARRDWRAILTMGLTFAATVAVGWLASPEQSRLFWFESLFDSTRVGDTTDMYNVSLNSLIAHLGTPESLQRPLWLLASAAVVVLGYLAIRRSDERGDLIAAISANSVVMLAISPISWFHHWVWIALVLPALWVAVRRRRAGVRAAGTALLVAMVPVFMLSSITVTMMLTGSVSGQGPVALELFTSLGVILPVAALAFWATAPIPGRQH